MSKCPTCRAADGRGGRTNAIFNQSLALWPSEFQRENCYEGRHGLAVSFTRFFSNSLLITIIAAVGNVLSASFAA